MKVLYIICGSVVLFMVLAYIVALIIGHNINKNERK